MQSFFISEKGNASVDNAVFLCAPWTRKISIGNLLNIKHSIEPEMFVSGLHISLPTTGKIIGHPTNNIYIYEYNLYSKFIFRYLSFDYLDFL